MPQSDNTLLNPYGTVDMPAKSPRFIFIIDGVISGVSPNNKLVEFVELPQTVHPFFVGTQAHPEFTSYPQDPNPLFWGLVQSANRL